MLSGSRIVRAAVIACVTATGLAVAAPASAAPTKHHDKADKKHGKKDKKPALKERRRKSHHQQTEPAPTGGGALGAG